MRPDSPQVRPASPSERYVIVDALRGFALLGIVMANYPEFSLYTFFDSETKEAFATHSCDRVVNFLQYLLVDGKFYTIFSLLFGLGFSIILSNAERRGGDGLRVFYRRMGTLAAVGLLHLMLLWSGDILLLYALLGFLLPAFRRASDRRLLAWAAALLLVPVMLDFFQEVSGVSLSAFAVRAQSYWCERYGITDENFARWLRDATCYADVFHFLIQGALVRVQEFVDGHRYFRVFALFLLGYYIGRKQVYARLGEYKETLRKLFRYGLLVGAPVSILYAWSSTHSHAWGLTVHSLLFLTGVFPLSFAYVSGMCLLYLRKPRWHGFACLSAPGRMALSNYIGQSAVGMFLFYGIGLGFGASIGLTPTEGIAIAVFVLQMLFSSVWLSAFRFGPLEWLWRMLTYGKYFPLIKQSRQTSRTEIGK